MEKLMKHTFCQQILSFTTVTFVMKTSNENKRRNFVTQVHDSFEQIPSLSFESSVLHSKVSETF